MLQSDITITHQVDDAKYLPGGKVYRYVRVEFLIGDHGPFRVEVPQDDFSAMKRDDAIEARARELRQGLK